jgi:hypothetical protein
MMDALHISTDINAHEVDPSKRPMRLFRISLFRNAGVEDAFRWLAGVL